MAIWLVCSRTFRRGGRRSEEDGIVDQLGIHGVAGRREEGQGMICAEHLRTEKDLEQERGRVGEDGRNRHSFSSRGAPDVF